MFVARLLCSDTDCAEEQEVLVDTLDELERLLCDCGCALALIAWPDWAQDGGQVVVLGDPAVRSALPVAA